MNRHHGSGYREVVGAALDLAPPGVRPMLDCHFLTDTDAVFVGLHGYVDTPDGRSYRTTAHVSHPHHQRHLPADRRETTVVLPRRPSLRTVVHELGHVLHERLRWEPDARPVTEYARTDRYEAFAEAWTHWLLYGPEYVDPATAHLLESLAVR